MIDYNAEIMKHGGFMPNNQQTTLLPNILSGQKNNGQVLNTSNSKTHIVTAGIDQMTNASAFQGRNMTAEAHMMRSSKPGSVRASLNGPSGSLMTGNFVNDKLNAME